MIRKAFKKLIDADCNGAFNVLAHDPSDDTYLVQHTKLAKNQVVGFGSKLEPKKIAARAMTNSVAGGVNAGCWVRSKTQLKIGSTVVGTLHPHPAVAAADRGLPTLTIKRV